MAEREFDQAGGIVNNISISQVTVPSGTTTNIASFTLPVGVWVVFLKCNFIKTSGNVDNGQGKRSIGLATDANLRWGSRLNGLETDANQNAGTMMSLTYIDNVSSTTTYYFNVNQDSGESLYATAASYRAVRIC